MTAAPVVASVRSTTTSGSLWSFRPTWSQTLWRMTSAGRRRYPWLRLPPSRVLALRIRSKTDNQKKAYKKAFLFAVKQRTDRLPLLMLQVWMARQDLQDEPHVSASISSIDTAEWADRFKSLEAKGWSKSDIDHWIWIVSGEDGDVRVERFVSTERPKPKFLVTILARSDEIFRKPESLLSLMEYTSKHYFPSVPQSTSDIPALHDRKTTLTLTEFLLFLRRIVNHVQRIWPRSIVTVARLTVEYMRGLSLSTDANAYYHGCEVFNTALQLFKRPAANQPIRNREHNWRAQKTLLAMSDNLDKPLIINQASYRAIREVMVGLRKLQTERAVAIRYVKSWPPYRQEFDGLDVKRTAEDDFSRSVRAGVVMKEAGYPEDTYDQALSALGGIGANSPTIQTVSLSPREWKDDEQDRNLYSHWAMMIRATRNSQEAWKVFNQFVSTTNQSPNIQIYAEMFIKLHARPVDPESKVLPGDSREVFPIHDANYSDYELARLSPPSVAELYDQMISRGIKPGGHCLHTLLINANSLEEASRYLLDSGFNPSSIKALTLFKEPSYEALKKISLLVFKSYIQLLCNLQPTRRGQDRIPSGELYCIRHAIRLTSLRLRPGTTEGSTFQPPWSIILRALARPHISLLNGTQADNDAEALSVSMDVIQLARERVGVDPDMFLYLCRTVQKVAVSRLGSREMSFRENGAGEASLVPSAETVSQTLKATFSRFVRPVGITSTKPQGLESPTFMYNVDPVHLHAYMRALAFLEDTTTMKDLLQWMLSNKSYIDKEAEQMGNRGHALVAKTLCAFQAFAGLNLTHEEQEDMASQMENTENTSSSWRWPTPEEVENYVGSDRRGGSERLQQRIMAKAWMTSLQDREGAIGLTG